MPPRRTPNTAYPWAIGMAAIGGGAALLGAEGGANALPISTLSPGDVLTAMFLFFVVAIFLERAVEVSLNLIYAGEGDVIAAGVEMRRATEAAAFETLQRNLAMLDTERERLAAISAATAEQTRLQEETVAALGAATPALAQHRQRKTRIAIMIALVFGIAISLSGFQILAALGGATGADAQATLADPMFRAVDIVLSGMMLAGGAEGVHQTAKQIMGGRQGLFPS